MPIAELKNVNYQYPLSKKKALKNVNCILEAGKFYGLIGENGGGKTTLCNLIRGLVPHFYQGELTGEALIFGKDIHEHNADDLAVRIGYVFQNPFNQMSGIKETVFEEIAMGLENLGVEKEEIIRRVTEVCRLLKIEQLIERNPNELSGGQRQRVAFAAIIAMDNELLVIDEPTSQLDPQGTEDVFEIIKTLKASGKTILLVEHKIDLIAEYCDEVIVMREGEVICAGKTQEILSDPTLPERGAEIPPVAVWGNELKRAGKPLGFVPITVEQAVHAIRERSTGHGD